MSKEVDNVNHPSHYEGNTSLECIECMRVAFGAKAVYDFCLCNAFKYLWRYKNKNGAEDIERDGDHVPDEIHKMYYRLNDLYIDITDKIANEGL
jgi:hypothetical protein